MKICIRADGGSNIGMGHIMRTLALAKKLKVKHDVFYVCRVDTPLTDKYAPGINLIKQNGFEVIFINEHNLKKDLNKIKANCLITDSYDVDEEYFDIAKKLFKISGCLDDEKICDYFNVDFLINQNPYADELNYKVNVDTKLMLGTKYVILRDEFRNINNENKKIRKNIKDIMVTVGGSDNNNLTETIINNIKKLDCNLHIVVGSGFKYIENLKKHENDNIKLYFNVNMKKLMDKCDLSISSCGTTIYELSSCGVPTIGIVVVENQEMAANKMDELGALKFSHIGDLENTIRLLNYDERANLSFKCRRLVDGFGIDRIISTIEECFKL